MTGAAGGAILGHARPRVGLLGIMQELYDDMIPGIRERQAGYAAQVAARLAPEAEVTFLRPAFNQAELEAVLGELVGLGLDGIMIVMLTYSPSMRSLRALSQCPLPLLLANIQPVPGVTADWDMADLTYNQGIHGAQDQANALLRAGIPYSVITEDWTSDAFLSRFREWARAAQTVTALGSTRIALFGYPMTGTGDFMADPSALLRRLGPAVFNRSLGDLHSRLEQVDEGAVESLLAEQRGRFAVAAGLARESHAYAARLELAFASLLEEGGFQGFCMHFESMGRDGRFRQLPLLAASDLMAKGYGYAAEGDTNTCSLMCASQTLVGDAHFSEMYAVDYPQDAVLVSHMGEGNWRVARSDRPVRLIDRELGIGGLDNPPTAVFSAQPGPATTACLVPLEGELYRLVVGLGEVLDTPELPKLEMPYFDFRPASGVRAFLDQWLRQGAGHHFVTNLGDQMERWRILAELLDIEFVAI